MDLCFVFRLATVLFLTPSVRSQKRTYVGHCVQHKQFPLCKYFLISVQLSFHVGVKIHVFSFVLLYNPMTWILMYSNPYKPFSKVRPFFTTQIDSRHTTPM